MAWGVRLPDQLRGATLFVDPYLSRVPFATSCGAGRPCPTRPRSTASSTPPARSPACSSATPTSTTRSTPRRSPGASAARPTARARWSALMGLHGLAEQAVEVEPYRTYELGPVRGQLHPQRPLEAAARPRRPLRRRAHLRAPRLPLAGRLPLRAGLGHLDRGRRAALLPPGQRQPDRRRDPRARRRRLPRRRRRAQLHPRLLEADPPPPRSARSSSRPTTTTSSARSASRWSSSPTSSSPSCPTEIGAVSADHRARRPAARRPSDADVLGWRIGVSARQVLGGDLVDRAHGPASWSGPEQRRSP